MEKSKALLAVLVGGAVLVAGAAYLAREHGISERKFGDLRRELDELRQSTSASVQHPSPPQIVRLIEKTERVVEGAPHSEDAHEHALKQDVPDPDLMEMSRLQTAEALKQALASQSRDPKWSTETERRLTATFSKRLPEGSTMRNLQCGSSMCLLELQQKTEAQFQQFVHNALVNYVPDGTDDAKFWGEATALISNRADSGEVSALVAVARDGQELPSLGQ